MKWHFENIQKSLWVVDVYSKNTISRYEEKSANARFIFRCLSTERDQPILYKFILKHLNDMTGESRQYVEWVNKSEGLFRFYSTKKDNFAEMWGRFKGKREHMTYQNMARALRNYTRGNRKIMVSVRKKLHYKFTPNFIQWTESE